MVIVIVIVKVIAIAAMLKRGAVARMGSEHGDAWQGRLGWGANSTNGNEQIKGWGGP